MSARPIVLVTGGRSYTDRERVFAELDAIGPGLVIEGGCRHRGGTRGGVPVIVGADFYAYEWGHARGVHVLTIEALWAAKGDRAGPLRNSVMLRVASLVGCSLVLAFPGGKGTADCVAKARAAGLEVREVP